MSPAALKKEGKFTTDNLADQTVFSRPKPGYYAFQKACRSILASAAISKFRWMPGEKFTTQVWILNDSPEKVKSGKLRATLISGDQKLDLGTWNFDALNANKNLKGTEFSQSLPNWKPGIFKLILQVEGRTDWNSEYILVVGKEAMYKCLKNICLVGLDGDSRLRGNDRPVITSISVFTGEVNLLILRKFYWVRAINTDTSW